MRKLLVFTILLGGLAAMTSCKKDYICECTNTSEMASSTSTKTINATEKEAIASCEKTTNFGGVKTVCVIK